MVIEAFVGERGAVDAPKPVNAENTRPADSTTAYRESDIDDRVVAAGADHPLSTSA